MPGPGATDLAPLPRLVIVIDEFAVLALELPDFIKGLVGIAQRGRSLGVHLILATQRPTGVVSPEIRANANFAIALRVVNSSESSDIIGTPDAAAISPANPGRAFLRISREPRMLSGRRVGGRGPGVVDTDVTVTAFLSPWAALGRPDPSTPTPSAPSDAVTDLHELVQAISQAAKDLGHLVQQQPWLDPLPPVITLDHLPADGATDSLTMTEAEPGRVAPLPFGLFDLPDEQLQRPACFDPSAGRRLLLAGSPRSGRSTALRAIAAAIAGSCPVGDVHLYALDCGNGSLTLRDLPHCGAVVTRNETDRAERLLARLADEVRRRQAALIELGMFTAAEQRTQPGTEGPWPYLTVMIDGWEGFLDAFHELKDGVVEQLLLGLLRDGAPVGLTVIVTGDRALFSTARISSLFEDRFALRFNDRDDYSLADLSPRKMPESVPTGRAFRAVSGEEMQVALLTADLSRIGPICRFRLAGRHRPRPGGRPGADSTALPGRRPADPDHPGRSRRSRAGPGPSGPPDPDGLSIVVGVGGDELSSWRVDLAEHRPGFVVTGSPESGRSTALLTFGVTLLARGCRMVVLTPRVSPLRTLAGRDGALVLEGAAARTPATEGPAALEALRMRAAFLTAV